MTAREAVVVSLLTTALVYPVGVMVGAHGVHTAQAEARVPHVPRVLLRSGSGELDLGEYVYLRQPDMLIRAIRFAENVPSYGNLKLAKQYGGHRHVPEDEGRAETARLLHRYYRAWVARGRPDTFLVFVQQRYAPLGAANDPFNLNRHWLRSVMVDIAAQQVLGAE